VRDIINGVCYQRCEKRLEQQEGRPNVNVCDAEENLEEELLCINKPVFNDRFISNKHTQYVFVRNTTFLSFFSAFTEHTRYRCAVCCATFAFYSTWFCSLWKDLICVTSSKISFQSLILQLLFLIRLSKTYKQWWRNLSKNKCTSKQLRKNVFIYFKIYLIANKPNTDCVAETNLSKIGNLKIRVSSQKKWVYSQGRIK